VPITTVSVTGCAASVVGGAVGDGGAGAAVVRGLEGGRGDVDAVVAAGGGEVTTTVVEVVVVGAIVVRAIVVVVVDAAVVTVVDD
jgi:hypothetical protein